MRVAINGFGRIGRAVLRIALEKGFDIVALNDLHGAIDASYLLKYDSVYGEYSKKVETGLNEIIVEGKKIKVLSEPNPEKLPWKNMKVDLVIESTGAFSKFEDAKKHLKAGAKRVIITAPGKGNGPTIVPGVNEKDLKKTDEVVSVASCTTNCLAPMLKILNDKFGVNKAFMTTIHAYTNSQNLVDTSDDKNRRRGRAGALNIIPTTTGASEAVEHVLPEMKGKVFGLSMRVPVACGSVVDLVAEIGKKVDAKVINKAFKEAGEKGMKRIVQYSEDELVSSDVIGNSHSAVFDSLSTEVNGNLVKILAWYDNEYGYSCRVVDVMDIIKKFVK